ncbi:MULTISPECIES: hypothetical protein [Bacillus cereus group]|uniref:hypothetical protein n=1 Tax=Bacillus cereus group TaxID=86661 RepID=UPI0007B69D43|nr:MULTISPECIES: hypothetical protein [Bacillus cereus group]ANC10492.1 hypothetical protein WR47_26400 [Bacillus cereus]ANC16308.1 hypothetical protein WR51_26400 [Bacillus cereus]MDA1992700.1 hypothetical protein [Bacillus cereus]MDA1998597.1 hypothetical protein [Bacillus cereus]MDA3650458.1 hypothetical protein [Bacillus cereus]
MTTIIKNEEAFIIDANVRESHMNRVDVLEKVKGLLLLPNLEMATTQQVADFYEVPKQAILSLVHDNRKEVEGDGYKTLKGKELVNSLEEYTTILKRKGHCLLESGDTIAYGNNGVFPRRAILRVGMLLRDSAIAKEVRTQLLNIEEKTTQEVKVADINEEQTLQMAVGQAFMSGDINALAQAATGLMAFKNRHIAEIETKLEEQKTVIKVLAKEEVSFKTPEKVLQNLTARYGKANGGNYQMAWKDLQNHLWYKVTPGINLKSRKTRAIRSGKKGVTYPKVIKRHEFPTVISAMIALCENKGIDVEDILQEVAE